MKICVLGLGYIGLPTACLFANANHEVLGIDINQATIEKLNHNELPFEENGLTNLFENAYPNMQFKTGPEGISKLMRNKNVVDTRKMLDAKRWEEAGFSLNVLGVGR